MLRSPISVFIFLNVLLICLILAACGFLDFRPIKYTVEPDNLDSLLNDFDTPLIIRFDTEMVKKDVENIFQVNSDSGAVKGDFNWEENSLYFIPVSGWTPGIRYTYGINGTIRSKDGRELLIRHYSSFYAVSRMPLPVLKSHYPEDGQSVNSLDFSLELHFTHSMDRLSVESALSIDGMGNKTYEWKNDDKTVIVKTDKQLAPWTSYRWNLKDSAKNSEGLPLPKQYSGSFFTDLDQVFPEVKRVYPAVFAHNHDYLDSSSQTGSWIDTGKKIENGLALGEGIVIEFNKPVEESVLRHIRFEPSLTGRAEMLAENKIVYIITRNPEPETVYTLTITSDVKDTEGLKLESDYRLSFTPDIPYLKVLSVNNGKDTVENLSSGMVLPVYVNSEKNKAVFSLRFSILFNNEEKQNAAQKIKLSPFFPKTLRPIGLQFIMWTSDDRIYMEWEGLETGIEEKNYYLLTIPGGRNGIDAQGFFIKEDLNIYLEAVNEI